MSRDITSDECIVCGNTDMPEGRILTCSASCYQTYKAEKAKGRRMWCYVCNKPMVSRPMFVTRRGWRQVYFCSIRCRRKFNLEQEVL